MDVRVRMLLPCDWPSIMHVKRVVFGTGPDLTRLSEELQVSGFVARFASATLAGYALLWIPQSQIELLSVAVHPEFRRIGIGTQLVRRACQSAQASHCDLVATVGSRNQAICNLLERAGGFECDWECDGLRTYRFHGGAIHDGGRPVV